MRRSDTTQYHTLSHLDQEEYSKTIFGFWIYLLTDFMMFATLFAVYAVLRESTLGGPSGKEIFDLRAALNQTLVLLIATFFVGVGGVYAHRNQTKKSLLFFVLNFVFNALFLFLLISDLKRIIEMGQTWKSSAFMSAYFTLIGTFAIHVVLALLWTILFLIPVFYRGITPSSLRRLTCLRMFWQFLNIVWVFIFSIIYLLGAI